MRSEDKERPVIRIGAKMPSSGPLAREISLPQSARVAEQAGFDSVWVSDHVVMLRHQSSPYPFSSDGKMGWDPEDPWHDPLISMAVCGAVTERVEIGVAVLVVPLRNPVILAKQLASLDVVTNGRVVVGAGAGWLKEEFEVLDTSFETRGTRLDEWIAIMRDCWTGEPSANQYEHYRIPEGVLAYPTPAHPVPILIGGMTPAALRRAGRIGNGWVGLQSAEEIDPAILVAAVNSIGQEAARHGRPSPERMVLRVAGPTRDIARRLPELINAGITDLVVDVDWDGDDGPRRTLETLRAER